MSFLAQGRIVWATISDPRGANPKLRPVVILTESDSIDPDGVVAVAALTTLIGEAPFAETVELPSDPNVHPVTKLKKRCEVVCSWVRELPVRELQDAEGSVPEELMLEILRKVKQHG